jgi:hypothetical protein
MFTLRTGVLILSLLVLLGVVSGVLRTLARDFGFRLTVSAAGLRRRRGPVHAFRGADTRPPDGGGADRGGGRSAVARLARPRLPDTGAI